MIGYIFMRFKPNKECLDINENKVRKKKVYNNDKLEEWIVYTFGNIEVETIEKISVSIYNRIDDCRTLKGGLLNY